MKIDRVDISGRKILETYLNCMQAEKWLKENNYPGDSREIIKACNGVIKYHAGFCWQYMPIYIKKQKKIDLSHIIGCNSRL